MKETTIQIKTEFEKVNAIRICMNGKGGYFEQELADYVDTLYKKYVPQAVREFIEKADEQEQTAARRVTRRKPVYGPATEGGTETRGEE
jgi:hypothetical protein